MRVSLLPILAAVALALAAPAASARPIDPFPSPVATPAQDLRSPDARDASAAGHAHSLGDIAKRHSDPADARWLAMERYYSSYGKAQAHAARYAAPPADDSSPWPAIGIGLALVAVVAGSVAVAVRTRRRTRVAV